MATFADVIKKQRKEGSSRTGAIATAIGQKTLESIDPRQFFNQSGVLTALFPSLKAYQAKGSSDKPEKGLDKLASLQVSGDTDTRVTLEEMVVKLNDVTIYTRLTAKNSTVLPQMARDMNLTKQNIGKLVNAQGLSQATKAEMFFKRAGEREAAVEAARKRGERTTPTKVEQPKESKGFLATLLMGLSGLLSPFKSLFDGLKGLSDAIGSAMKLLLSGISTFSGLVTSLIGNIFKGAFGLLANPAALAAAGLAGLAYLIYKLIKSDIDATKEDRPLPPPDTPEQLGERPQPTGKGIAQLKDEHDRQQKALEIGRAADPTGSYDVLEAKRAQRALENSSTSPSKVQSSDVSEDLVNFIKSKEGFTPSAKWDYKQWSIGYGTKSFEGETITEPEADRRLREEISNSQKSVIEHALKHGYNWDQKKIDALTSFAYNLGPGALNQLTAGGTRSDEEIAKKLLEYNKVRKGGELIEERGLTQRRTQEFTMFAGLQKPAPSLTQTPPTSGSVVASTTGSIAEGRMMLASAPTTQTPVIVQDNSKVIQNAGGSAPSSPLSAWDNLMLESIISRMA